MGTTQIVNGILVTFTGDPLKKAIEIVGMFDRLALRPAADEPQDQSEPKQKGGESNVISRGTESRTAAAGR